MNTRNTRVRDVRKELDLNQADFAAKLGVTAAAISRIEVGERNLTEQMVIAICREYNVSEYWLRTGEGEMFVVAEDTLIRQLSDTYELDELDQAIIKGYLKLPRAHKDVIKHYLSDVTKISDMSNTTDKEKSDKDEEYRAEWNKNLTEEEAVALVRQRYADSKKGELSSTTSENPEIKESASA